MTALEQPALNLDALLRAICAELRLSDALHLQAQQRYAAVGSWLLREGGLLAPGKPELYPQGSLRLGTTVRPRGAKVHDLDIVSEVEASFGAAFSPVQLLDLLEHQLRANQTYAPMVRRKNRCIRLEYANDFHLDILPAFRDPSGPPGALFVPDRKTRAWKASNPKGYAHWFETTEQLALGRVLDGIEPLPAPMTAPATPTLRRLVQLLKQFRDVRHETSPEVAPISIVLTTLAADHYVGEKSETDAMTGFLGKLIATIPTSGRLLVLNPANKKEDLSERWNEPASYAAFLEGVDHLRAQWERLRVCHGLKNIAKILGDLFGDDVVDRAIRTISGELEDLRSSGQLGLGSSGVLIRSPQPQRPLHRNTFYGHDE